MLHEAARKHVCILCFRKTEPSFCLSNASDLIRKRLEEHVITSLDLLDSRVPTSLCKSCRTKLHNIEKDGRSSTINIQILLTFLSEQKRISPRATSCPCEVCAIANSFGANAQKLKRKYSTCPGRPSQETTQVHRLCGICLSPIYRGSNHTKESCASTKQKLENVYNALTEGERQQLASRINSETAAASQSSTFQLKTLGRPQYVTIGKPASGTTQITHSDVDALQRNANLSNTQTLQRK